MSETQQAMDASYILEHPLFKRAFLDIERDLLNEIKRGDMLNDKLTTRLMLALQMLQAIEDRLRGHIDDAEYQATDIGEL